MGNAPNTTTHPAIYGIKASFTFALSSALDIINLIPKYIPIISANAIPIPNKILYKVFEAFFKFA